MSFCTFRYFKVAGFGETSRLLLTAAQVEWIEENPEWPQEKPNQPFGRLPVLIEQSADSRSDLILSESATIERYIARTYGFLPADPRQAALQEQLRDRLNDVILAYFVPKSVNDEAKAEAQAKFEGLLDKLVTVNSELLRKSSNNGHLFGSTLSLADIATYAFLWMFLVKPMEALEDSPQLVKAKLTPELAKLAVTVEADPLLKAYAVKTARVQIWFRFRVIFTTFLAQLIIFAAF